MAAEDSSPIASETTRARPPELPHLGRMCELHQAERHEDTMQPLDVPPQLGRDDGYPKLTTREPAQSLEQSDTPSGSAWVP